MISIFDIECNGFLDTLDTVHSLVIHQNETLHSFYGDKIVEGLELLKNSTQVVGHNIICYDLPALKKVYGFEFNGAVYDTLNVSRLIYTDMFDKDYSLGEIPKKLYGSHSLEAWGHRLDITKGDFNPESWDKWSLKMQRYCEQDVRVSVSLYKKLQAKQYSPRAIELEHKFQKVIHQQEQNGVLFDTNKAKELALRVTQEIDTKRTELRDILPYYIKKGKLFTPKRDNKTVGYRKGCEFTKLKIEQFNPSSRQQVIEYFLNKYDWRPEVFTNNDNPKIDDEVLRGMDYPEAKHFADLFERIKILGYLEKGKNAWLKLVKNGRIYGKMITNGAVTGRCTHAKPNLAQVPSARKYLGKECRSLFHSGHGWMIGADASGLELRMLAHYLAAYDGGKYAREILTGDIHTANQRAADLETRDQAKTFIYAYCYGAGDAKLGSIVTGSKDETKNRKIGKDLRSSFLRKIDGLQALQEDVKRAANRGYLKGLDGRLLHIRSEHKALNTLLQGGGAIIMKQANVNFWDGCDIECQQVLNVHDEVQLVTNVKENCDLVGQRMVDSIIKSGEDFNLRIPLDGEYNVGKNWADTH